MPFAPCPFFFGGSISKGLRPSRGQGIQTWNAASPRILFPRKKAASNVCCVRSRPARCRSASQSRLRAPAMRTMNYCAANYYRRKRPPSPSRPAPFRLSRTAVDAQSGHQHAEVGICDERQRVACLLGRNRLNGELYRDRFWVNSIEAVSPAFSVYRRRAARTRRSRSIARLDKFRPRPADPRTLSACLRIRSRIR